MTWPLKNLKVLTWVTAVTAALLMTTFGSPAEIARADVPVSQDDFEGGEDGDTGFGWLGGWQFGQGSGFWNNDNPRSGSSHMRVHGNGASAIRTAEITGESALILKLWVKARNLDDDADAIIEVSADGSNYVELHRWSAGDDDDTYRYFEFELSSTGLVFQHQLWVRVQVVGEKPNKGSLFIDDMEIVNTVDDPDPGTGSPDSPVTMDGQFGDWTGKANITDPQGDQDGSSRLDVATLYWTNNIPEEINYHMIERYTKNGQPFNGNNGQTGPVRYILYVDTNNNGSFADAGDRRAVITYAPARNRSFVNVKVFPANSSQKISDSGWQDWGDSRDEGGLRVEFPLDWNNLDIEFGAVIRMYAISFTGLSSSPSTADRIPDGNADIQWSPASVLGPWLLGIASVGGMIALWYISRRKRLWT